MEQYIIYLRKSRKDDDIEQRGEGETLARHKSALLDLAKKKRLRIAKIYEEVVSGDSIDARPEMLKLLKDVESGAFAGVLVIEVERLARGDTIDQGRVAQAFKYSDTKIITPNKTYDPKSEFDIEYFEFGLFMSRREFEIIKRRLRRGREASVKEGKYTASKAPYGYNRVKLEKEKGWTLEPHPEQAEIVRMVYEWYTIGVEKEDGIRERIGVSLIARRLNKLKILPQKGKDWATASIRDMLINPVYIGKVRWNWRPEKRRTKDNIVIVERPRVSIEDCILVDGKHEGIIDTHIFELAQTLMTKNPPRPIGERYTVKNPWAGIIICGKCGNRMTRRPYNQNGYPDTLLCQKLSCDNISSHLDTVEKRILEALGEWLTNYKLKWNLEEKPSTNKDIGYTMKAKALAKLDKEIDTLQKRLDSVHDRFEDGVYSTEQFLERSHKVGEEIQQAKNDRAIIAEDLQLAEMREEARTAIIPKVDKLLEVYHELPTPKAKNDLLKDILEKVVYTKTVKGTRSAPSDIFEIVLFPKLPTGV